MINLIPSRASRNKALVKLLANNEAAMTSAQNSGSAFVQAAVEKAIVEKQQQIPDSEVVRVINDEIAKNYLGAPLTLTMQQHYLSQFRSYIGQGMSYDQAFNTIASEFGQATENQDTDFYQSRTGINISGGTEQNSPTALAPAGNVRTAGASDSGNNNLLIYGAIAVAGFYLLFGNKSKGLSGTPKKENTKSRKPAKKAQVKGKGSPATKSKKSGRMQVVYL